MITYPTVIQFKNIKPEKRTCAQCGGAITGRGNFYIPVIARGKYLCRKCEVERNGETARRYLNTRQ